MEDRHGQEFKFLQVYNYKFFHILYRSPTNECQLETQVQKSTNLLCRVGLLIFVIFAVASNELSN